MEASAAPDDSWRLHASCRGAGPELFFPAKGEPAAEAKEVCQRCPVADCCLDFAIRHGEETGIWGGMSERQRREVARARRNAADERPASA